MLRPLFWQLGKKLFKKKMESKLKRRVRTSGFFDEAWYLEQYPDIRAAGIDPLEHFCCFGDRELRHPSVDFDSHLYAKVFDVNTSRMGPFEHLASHSGAFQKKLLKFFAQQAKLKPLERQVEVERLGAERDDYRLRYYTLKAAFDRSVAEADVARRLYARETAKNKIAVLVND